MPDDREQRVIRRATVLKVFAALLVVSFLLRIFYAGHLYQDDGLWFTAAEEILRGKALYREIYFDKPPAAALLYALLFKLFGAHIMTIRVFTIFYSVAVSAVLYLLGLRLYDRRAGLIAAAMFTVFSTTYTTGHVQGLNTDFLMTLPYTAGAYFFIRSIENRFSPSRLLTSRARMAFAGGALAGIAFQVNPKAIFDLIFFAVLLTVARKWIVEEEDAETRRRGDAMKEYRPPTTDHRSLTPGLRLFLLAVPGFMAGSLLFLGHIAATRSLSAYWLYVWDWGHRYASYYPIWKGVTSALLQSANYFALNNTLFIALAFVLAVTISRARLWQALRARKPSPSESEGAAQALFRSDVILLIWFAVSYAGLAVGGRFFGHYFFQIMPALCLIGARGLTGILSALNANEGEKRFWKVRRAALALIALGFIFTLVRFHGRTAALAADWIRGSKSEITARWFHERLKLEERMASAVVSQLPGGADAAESVGLEGMRAHLLGDGAGGGSPDYLFVWGYRPEIYYWSGLLPASRYLSTQPLTGVPADVHYFGDRYVSLLDERLTASARAELLHDLEQTQPKFIIDELGFFNADLSVKSFPELREFMKAYKDTGAVGRFIIYRKKDPAKKKRLREGKPQQ